MISKYFYNLSVTIVGIVTLIFILTNIGGLLHIPVNPFYVLIPFICGLYYLKKQSPENIDFLKQFLILLLIIMTSYFLSIAVWDVSWDGRWYHSATIIMFKNGWLPIYQNYQDFARLCHVYPYSAFWGNCYLHFVEIIGANIYKLTNLLESAKTVNYIILSAVFMYSFAVLMDLKPQKNFILTIISLIIILNPVCICQWATNFIDLQIYFAFSLLILTIIKIELQQNAEKTDLFMFVCSSLMLTMTKFTGCMYMFVIFLIYLLHLSILKRNIKKYIKTVLVIGNLIAITGVNPFFTNIRDFGHPFHPIFGNHKKDFMCYEIPYGFEKMSMLEKFLRSTFSETVNSISDSDSNVQEMKITPKLKIPFTLKIESCLSFFQDAEMRVGGFGYFWSGILLLSLLYLPFLRFRNKNEKNIFWLITSMILATTFSNPHCWWARFVPQFWLFPIFILFFGLLQYNYKNNFSKIFKLLILYFIIVSFFVNSSIIVFQNIKSRLQRARLIKVTYDNIDSVKKLNDKIYLMVRPDESDFIADETYIPHLEEYYGKKNIIYVPYDENRIKTKEFIPLQNAYVINEPCYFFKIDSKQ